MLRKALDEVREQGFSDVYVGVEMEYFYFKNKEQPIPLDIGDYFDVIEDFYGYVRKQTMLGLKK